MRAIPQMAIMASFFFFPADAHQQRHDTAERGDVDGGEEKAKGWGRRKGLSEIKQERYMS